MKRLISLAILILINICKANSQDPSFPIINYTTKNYGSDFNPTNRAIVQDHRGIIYAANGFRLLEFDGHTWTSYPINSEKWILSLAADTAGVIYAGSQNEFGHFIPDKVGKLKYQSLSDSIKSKENFTNIWKVHAFSGGVIFQAEEDLFLYRNGKIKVFKPQTSFHTSFNVNNKIYVRERNKGLMQLNDTGFVKISGSEIFDTTGIFLMVPFDKNNKKILIGTQEKGFWMFEPGKSSKLFSKFYIDKNVTLEKSRISGGVNAGNGLVAISTLLNGLIIIDSTGKTRAILNSKNGLNDDDVKQVIYDQNQDLWVALNKGISRIEISSPLSFYSEKSGISGSVNTIKMYNDHLYLGTTTGLFVEDYTASGDTRFKHLSGITDGVTSLTNVEGMLVAGTESGLYQISDNFLLKFGNERSYTVLYSPGIKLLFSGGSNGLSCYQFNGSFKQINSLKVDVKDIIGIQEEINRTGSSPEFWFGTMYNGAFRLKINNDQSFISDYYMSADGLPDGWVIPVIYDNKTLFETTIGLYSFTNENIVRESIPDSLKNNKDFNKGYFSVLNEPGYLKDESVSLISENRNKIWICFNNRIGYADRNKSSFVTSPFNGIETGKINFLYPEETGICWIGTSDGLIKYNEKTGKDYNRNYYSLIRKVIFIDVDSSVFMGTSYKNKDGYIKIIPSQDSDNKVIVSYSNNSIRIEFSAPFFEYSSKIVYSYKLEGSRQGWSQWKSENFQEFTNLHEGKYTFIVKAKNVYGKESEESKYSFTILPPWYRSTAAYVLYIISAFILLWLFARIYSYKLKKENIRLEGIVSERTAEVVRQKDEIITKNTLLEHQKKEIEDSIRYASRIQSAVIPTEKMCNDIFPESFVLFKPLNIVSGDFYWISRVGKTTIYTAADCTGHGVPGGFMSMLGIAFLNEIINNANTIIPDQILNRLREKVIHALQQQGISGEARDGMDIAIVSINAEEHKLQYAGAYNPLILIRKGEIIEISGDKMPIGIYENMHPFTNHEIPVEKGDVFYMYSDGFEDQFGGPDGKKFKAKNLKNLLLQIHGNSMIDQKEILNKSFEEWKGSLPQVDDVVIVGLTIK